MAQANRPGLKTARGRLTLWLALWLAAVSCMNTAATGAAPPNPMPPESVASETLDNGLRVIVRRDDAATTAVVDLWIRAGATADGGNGAAHALEHMVFKGSESVPAGAADVIVEAVGGVLYAETLADATHYWAAVPPDQVAVALTAVARLMREPTVSAEEWERERRVMLEEIARSQTDDAAELRRSLAARLFGLPFAAPVAGTPEALKILTPEAIRAFYRRAYRPDAMTLVVVGPVSMDTVRKGIPSTLGAIPTVKAPPSEPLPVPPAKALKVEYAHVHGNRVEVGLAYPAAGGAAVDVLSTIIAQRLSARVSGIADRVEVSHPWQRAGIMVLAAGGPAENESALRDALLRVAASAASGISSADVGAAVGRRQWAWWLDHERPKSQAKALGLAATLGDLGEATTATERFSAVTTNEVRAAADAIFGKHTVLKAD